MCQVLQMCCCNSAVVPRDLQSLQKCCSLRVTITSTYVLRLSLNSDTASLRLPPDFPGPPLKSQCAFLAVLLPSPSPHAVHSGPETVQTLK